MCLFWLLCVLVCVVVVVLDAAAAVVVVAAAAAAAAAAAVAAIVVVVVGASSAFAVFRALLSRRDAHTCASRSPRGTQLTLFFSEPLFLLPAIQAQCGTHKSIA